MSIEHGETYLAGIATADVTPPIGTPMSGFVERRIHSSTGVYHPLRAVAVVLDDGRTPILILSVEWVGFGDRAEYVRERLNRMTGIATSQIVLIASHTHCGPAIGQHRLDILAHGWIDDDYFHSAVEAMAAIADRAWKHRYPAMLQFGVGRCALAVNRRIPDPANPGRVLRDMMPNPHGPTDHDVPVLMIKAPDHRAPRGILFSYACHPTSRGGLLFGGDYVGFAHDYIQEAFMCAQPCFLQGCGGDQKPRPVDPAADGFGERTVEQVKSIGNQLGEAVVSVLREDKLQPVAGPIVARQAIIELETEPLDKQAVKSALSDPKAAAYWREWARYHQERIDKGLPEQRKVPFEIQVIRFGQSLVIVTMSAEMTVEHGLRLKKDLREKYPCVLPLGYTNGAFDYVSAKRQFSELGYEVLDGNLYAYRTGRYVLETEDQIHATVGKLLDEPTQD